MSAIAQVLLDRGHEVSGSDLRDSQTLTRLRSLGARIGVGHQADLCLGADTLIVSDAIPTTNPELSYARDHSIPILTRAQALACLLEGKRTIAIAGTHGKTTTTGMVSTILESGGLEPLTLIGGELGPEGSTARLGRGTWAVAEACEAFNAFLSLRPQVAVITNVEPDHLDFHKTFANLLRSFRAFVGSVSSDGLVIGCTDSPPVVDLLSQCRARHVSYGLKGGDYTARDLSFSSEGAGYTLMVRGRDEGRVSLAVTGEHNVANSLAALAVAEHTGLGREAAIRGVAGFRGVRRRFDLLGEERGVRVYDDYAHHPTEVRVTLKAARQSLAPRRLILVFQPHLYSRTRLFLKEFAEVLAEPDLLLLTDIYAARERPLEGFTGKALYDAAKAARRTLPTEYHAAPEAVPASLKPRLQAGDVVIVMGAGDIRRVGEALVEMLRRSGSAEG